MEELPDRFAPRALIPLAHEVRTVTPLQARKEAGYEEGGDGGVTAERLLN